jgi:hypothetical protein
MSREQHVREAVDRFIARQRQATDAHLEALAAELLQLVRGDMRTSRGDIDRAAVEVARAVAKGGAHARHDLISRVADAVRRLDDATTLRGVLDALADGASAEAARVAVMIVDGGTLRSYRQHGFPPGVATADLPVSASPLLTAAVTLRQVTTVPGAAHTDATVPAFLRVPVSHTGLILPVVVQREAVAVLYADGPDREGDQAGAPVWTEQVEVLVRHASSRLENVTSQRTVEALTSGT